MTDTTAAPTVGLGVKISYGLGALAQGVGGVALAQGALTFFLVRVVGLRPTLVSTVILISLVIDAVIDPLIGRWSDTFRSPWGRRHPFMYASAIPIALAIVFLWRHPAGLTGFAMAAYALGVLIVARLAGGLYTIPSDALTPELAPDYHARTGLISYRWFFGVFGGAVMGIVLSVVFLRKDASHPLGPVDPAAYANFGVTAAIIVFLSIVVSAVATHRYIPQLSQAPQRRQSLGHALKEIVSIVTNPSLIAVMASGLVSGIAGGITGSISAFMNYYFWGLTPQVAGWIGVAALPGIVLGVIAAPILSRALDKKRTMITVFTLAIFTGVIPVALRLLGLMPPNGSVWIPTILGVDTAVGTMLAISGFVLVSSMIADVVEDSAVKTGVRSEGLLFAANGLLPKVTTGIGGMIGALMLEASHFPAGAVTGLADKVDPAVMRHLALLSLPAGTVLNLIAVAVLLLYRIDRSSHEANLAALGMDSGLTGPPPTAIPGAPAPVIEPGPMTPTI